FSHYSVILAYRRSRYLHSVPTRRSSDLLLEKARLRKQFRRLLSALMTERVIMERSSRLSIRILRRLPSAATFTTKMGALLRCKRDRKSTRLNSSHGSISYAVFCLKKKTI